MMDTASQLATSCFLPVLMRLTQITRGPIIEMGCHEHATPYLHWRCLIEGRQLRTYESDETAYRWAKAFEDDRHHVHYVQDWDVVDVTAPCAVAIVAQRDMQQRKVSVRRISYAEFVVCPDVVDGEHIASVLFRRFRHRRIYSWCGLQTVVASKTFALPHLITHPEAQEMLPPGRTELRVVSEQAMLDTQPGMNRRYTICRAVREVYANIQDPLDRLKLRYACTLAEHVTAKVNHIDPTWLRRFYPRRHDFGRVMGPCECR